ncbi:N-formylglutamate deformylase [Parasulfitobacter algicola]|uniref:N-formylglutamate deformylase n=1 Tax=Parasulfitobacter algicola TaxID=2614809 RepID=A0ABX2IZH4_9RHOB|nr:N-formylglutamate deformylase [Sulfitobacter algicola]NSX56151.1 N-formylglutamate deformylase [Sulfitobacter algicola]
MKPVEVICGDVPIVLGLPHTGTHIPPAIFAQLNDIGQEKADTDWHIDRLYDGVLPNATTVRATFHRYVIDANRDPDGISLYPGQNTTQLVPLTDFDGRDIWQVPPSEHDMAQRCVDYHTTYHAALRAELDRVYQLHGMVILFDCHSIRSYIPYLFQGILPDFNIGTNDGTTCHPMMQHMVEQITMASDYTSVSNGRFKGGWTTRHYGQPNKGRHAIQLELAQSTYLTQENPPWTYDPTKADRLRNHLADILTTLTDIAPKLKGAS